MHRFRTRLLRLAATTAALVLLGVMGAAPSFAAPALEVSDTTGLKTGQSITVSGEGFAPNLKGIAVGQCRVGFVGPSDCNLAGGATFRNADASGSIGTITLKVSESFGQIDCTKEQCVIAAQPLPTTSGPEEVAANTVTVPVSFGDAAPPTPAAPEAPAPPAASSSVPPVAAPAPVAAVAGAVPVITGEGSGARAVGLALVAGFLGGGGLVLGLRKRGVLPR